MESPPAGLQVPWVAWFVAEHGQPYMAVHSAWWGSGVLEVGQAGRLWIIRNGFLRGRERWRRAVGLHHLKPDFP